MRKMFKHINFYYVGYITWCNVLPKSEKGVNDVVENASIFH